MINEIGDILKKLSCPKDEKNLILFTLQLIKTYPDKPLSNDIKNKIHKYLSNLRQNEN
jgi:hypothetical protein